ncbi:mitochondrial import receptor subunit TOM40-1 [Trifolium repens]|nr:mitochondrial import receptor subunit TOM40-1 [Trifolium repens]
MGLNFVLSEELDHKKKDYKFGFGLTLEKLIRAGLDLYLHFFSQTSLASFLASFDLLDKPCSGVHRVYFMLL